jgi:hypothetical protein
MTMVRGDAMEHHEPSAAHQDLVLSDNLDEGRLIPQYRMAGPAHP